jgi:hypothetical protein
MNKQTRERHWLEEITALILDEHKDLNLSQEELDKKRFHDVLQTVFYHVLYSRFLFYAESKEINRIIQTLLRVYVWLRPELQEHLRPFIYPLFGGLRMAAFIHTNPNNPNKKDKILQRSIKAIDKALPDLEDAEDEIGIVTHVTFMRMDTETMSRVKAVLDGHYRLEQ